MQARDVSPAFLRNRGNATTLIHLEPKLETSMMHTENMLKLTSTPEGKSESWRPEHFRVLCAWCNFELRAPLLRTSKPAPESHGICESCAVNLGMPADYFAQRNVA